jgi:hypothetical protein
MASFIGRAVKLARSPAGKRLLAAAQDAARDPKNKARVEQVRRRISKGGADKTVVVGESTNEREVH